MTKKAATVGDMGTDHDGFPPTPIIEGSDDVFFDGKPAARVGDRLAPHAKPGSPLHDRVITTGSSTVLINGRPAALTGSEVGCGGIIIGGSSVIIGDNSVTIGDSSVTIGDSSVAIGDNSVTIGDNSVTIGGNSVTIGGMAPSATAPLNTADLFDEHFCIIDCETGIPFQHVAYGMTSSKGLVEGIVDKSGKTLKVTGKAEENLTLDYIFQTKIGLR